MIRWTGLAPWEVEFPFPGSPTSTFLDACRIAQHVFQGSGFRVHNHPLSGRILVPGRKLVRADWRTARRANSSTAVGHPAVELRANLKLIAHRCHLLGGIGMGVDKINHPFAPGLPPGRGGDLRWAQSHSTRHFRHGFLGRDVPRGEARESKLACGIEDRREDSVWYSLPRRLIAAPRTFLHLGACSAIQSLDQPSRPGGVKRGAGSPPPCLN